MRKRVFAVSVRVFCLAAVAVVSAGTVDYQVPDPIPVIEQPTSLTCWAAAAAMMQSWKDKTSYPIKAALDKSGDAAWSVKFAANQPMRGNEKPSFLQALKLRSEPPVNYSAEGLQAMLKNHGPLWVTVSTMDPDDKFSTHARILYGITGDGTADGTFLQIIDPDGGRRYSEALGTFTRKFEEIARVANGDNGELRPQIVHF